MRPVPFAPQRCLAAANPLDVEQGIRLAGLLQWVSGFAVTRFCSPVPPIHSADRPPRPVRREVPAEPWRFVRLLDAPHRLGFFTGAVMLSASAPWWLVAIASRLTPGWNISWAVAPAHSHALPTAATWLAGWGIFLTGAHADATLGVLGLAVVASGWSLFAWRLARMLRASTVADDVAWALFWLLQATIALRIAGASRGDAPALLLAAALLWAAAMLAWSIRYVRWYGQPRSDGRPG